MRAAWAYADPPKMPIGKLKRDRQMMRRRVLQLFRFNLSTMAISHTLKITEAEAYNLLHEAQNEEHALEGRRR